MRSAAGDGEDVKNDSLEEIAGWVKKAWVICASGFRRRMHMTEDQKKQMKKDLAWLRKRT